jgi:signal peptidase II
VNHEVVEWAEPTPGLVRMARKLSAIFVLLFTLALFGCDHATKALAEGVLQRQAPLSLVPGVIELRYAENHDIAFSALGRLAVVPPSSALLAFGAAAIVALAIAWWVRRRAATSAEHLAFGLILAGALGNVVDRAARGYVVDFIHVTHWPVFNVADVAIVVGVALHAWLALRRRPLARVTGT